MKTQKSKKSLEQSFHLAPLSFEILGNGHKWPGSFRDQNLNFYDIYYSYEACQNEEQKSAELEDFLPSFELTGAITVHNDQDLNISTPEDCQANCFYETRRQAWTLQSGFFKGSGCTPLLMRVLRFTGRFIGGHVAICLSR